MSRFILILSTAIICFAITGYVTPSYSQDNVKQENVAKEQISKKEVEKLREENKAKVQAEIKKDTPITEWISSENALLDRLPKQNKQTFFILRNKHSVMRAVETVQRDVGNAVKACSKNNKDMAKEMNERFKDWSRSINPILKDAKKFLELELKEQKAFHITDYRHITKLNDKAYKFSEGQIKKTPVTTPKACQGLLDSMDRTEEDLINILQDVLLPEEVARKRSEQAKKARDEVQAQKAKREAERKAKEKAKK